MDYNLTKSVAKKKKPLAKFYSRLILILCIIFIVCGIIFTTGMFLPAFCLALFYFYYTLQIERDYEYHLEDGVLTIDVIKGKRIRRQVHELNMKDLVVLAPNWHDAVKEYRRDGGSQKLKKYDYTSYDDDIPYQTMIIYEDKKKIKILLDLDEEWMRTIKMMDPTKVYMDDIVNRLPDAE